MDSLNGDIGAAVDRAATAVSSGTTETTAPPASVSPPLKTPESPASALASASVSPAPAPAAVSGSETAPTQPGTTQAPATEATDDDGEIIQNQGWLDLEKRRSILQNARRRERAAVLENELGLPQGTNLQSVRTHLQALATDAVAYHRQLGETLRRRGLLPPEGAPPASTVQPQAPPAPRSRPEPDLVFSDGRRAYSEAAQADLMEWQREQLTAQFNRELDERFGPLQETHEHVQQEVMRTEARAVAQATLDECQHWHRFGEFRKQIAEMMVADKRVTVFSAYNRLLQNALRTETSRVKEQTRTETLDELQRRPGQSIVPSNPAGTIVDPAARKKSGSFDDTLTDAVSRAMAKHGS